MNKEMLLRLFCCLAVLSIYLYQVIQKQNLVNYLSLQIPKLNKDLKTLEEENVRLKFEIDCFESPDHLMKLVRSQQYAYLKYPVVKEVISLKEGLALQVDFDKHQDSLRRFKTEPVLAVGVSH